MKRIKTIILLAICCNSYVYAQSNVGIKFSQLTTWNDVLKQAEKENKYIFLDIYTTWCAPCKVMSKEIFPQQNVGRFFNQNFINVALQFDTTKNDNEEVKNWYAEVEKIKVKYKIDSYPTYLFFNQSGELVYEILGASENADDFISKSKNALNPNKQYFLLKSEYEKGRRDSALLNKLFFAARDFQDKDFLPIVGNEYLKTQNDLLSKSNLELITIVTSKSTDIGFDVLRFNSNMIDSTLGKSVSYKIVSDIISNEIVIPYLRNGGSKTNLGGGMVSYSGEINKNVNWNTLELKLKEKYPELSRKIAFSAKPEYYDWTKEWDKFSESVVNNITLYPELLDDDLMRYYMWRIIGNCEDKNIINNTIQWV
ncbi:MAG: thioredoxin fold domain-containing protein, partial [Bacteroidetes bacterium]|nr:thioredoxin fold domain-containing protein [Bacteroidota bacterium]